MRGAATNKTRECSRLAILMLGWVLSACSSSDKGAGPGSTGGQGGVAGGAGASGMSQSGGPGTGGAAPSGPAISTAPATWAPPADCQGIGGVCPNGIFDCTGKAVCQLEGNVCIPPGSDTGLKVQPKTAERPYCLAYQCMTYEEASCFCTGAAGKQNPTCSSPGAVAGLCTGAGSSCLKDKCCEGLTCTKVTASTSLCEKTCTTNADCDTGCCADTYGTGQTICAAASECLCKNAGGSCKPSCCDGLTCVKQSPTASTCEKTCANGSDCDTGCCTDLHDTGQTVCAAASACQNPCVKRGSACTPDRNTNVCCSGTCVTSVNSEFAGCRAVCNANADCDTGCCQKFTTAPGGFCAAAKYCSCSADGTACGSITDPECCTGSICASFGSGPSACFKKCTTNADCPSGCCSAPFAGETYGACTDASGCN
jgi:hypothetical protein